MELKWKRFCHDWLPTCVFVACLGLTVTVFCGGGLYGFSFWDEKPCGWAQNKYRNLLLPTEVELKRMSEISSTIDTLISWMEHDVLNMPGTPKKERLKLFDFILLEFEKLAEIHPHRILTRCEPWRAKRRRVDTVLAVKSF